jgi:hypothetical protein
MTPSVAHCRLMKETTMAGVKETSPKVQAAARDPKGGAQDRPGFDLGGAVEEANKARSEAPSAGPRASPGQGVTASGQADGYADSGGSRARRSDAGGSEAGGGPRKSTP